MQDIFKIILYSGCSGITVFLGGLTAYYFGKNFVNSLLKSEIYHFITAFGGGILIAAIALVLLPHGMEKLSLLPIVFWFALGAMVFFMVDKKLHESGSKLSQLLAMMLDFIPEAIALGALFATDPKTGILLAVFIGLQNLPESFNSFRDLCKSGYTPKKSMYFLLLISFTGIGGALLEHYFLRDLPEVTSSLMIFASGGILYLIFQDIAPKVNLKKSWIPALGGNFGFLLGIIGEKMIQ